MVRALCWTISVCLFSHTLAPEAFNASFNANCFLHIFDLLKAEGRDVHGSHALLVQPCLSQREIYAAIMPSS
jgi:hypothetical protein